MVRKPINIGFFVSLFLLMACALTAAAVPGQWKYFTANSYWRSKVQQAPVDPNSDYYIAHWKTLHVDQKIQLAGLTGTFGFQLYYGVATDPLWTITSTYAPITSVFHAPANMTYAGGSDTEVGIIDTTQDGGNGIMYYFGQASAFNYTTYKGNSVYSTRNYLKSNGLDGQAALTNEKRNVGHRGCADLTNGFIVSEVQALDIPHMVKMAIPKTGKSPFAPYVDHVWPYVGGEGNSGELPEGTRVRLKASVQPRIDALTNPYLKAMAQCLLTYGSFISDIGGGSSINIKLQTGGTSIADWAAMGITTRGALSMFTVDDFEIVQLGWVPPGT